jgi:hypothetical protein
LWKKDPKVWDMFNKEEKAGREAVWKLHLKELDVKKKKKQRKEEDAYNGKEEEHKIHHELEL